VLVPLTDASGVSALKQLLKRCARSGTRVILSGLREQPKAMLGSPHADSPRNCAGRRPEQFCDQTIAV